VRREAGVMRRREPDPLVSAEADELMDVVSSLAVRQEDLVAWLAERSARFEATVTRLDGRHSDLDARVAQLEAKLDHLTRDVVPRQLAQRSQRIAVLQQQVAILRGGSPAIAPTLSAASASDRAGAALIYAGSLLLVWLLLWQLALALGFG
jgi:hypothetical protein